MSIRFIIEDEAHAEWCGEFSELNEALQELKRRAELPWDQAPNAAPCKSWQTCGRNYEIVQFETSSQPWREISRTPALRVNAIGITWSQELLAVQHLTIRPSGPLRCGCGSM